MVKGLEKLLKTTRNILLAGAIGISSLFANDSRVELINYAEPTISKPRVYTEIHSKLPEELRKGIEYIFEDLIPRLLIYDNKDDTEKYLDTCEEIEDKYKEINLNDLEFPIDFKDLCYIPEEDFDKFKRYGYFFDKKPLIYGKLDSEEEILDDSWKDFGKKPEKRKVITYYSLPRTKSIYIGYVKGPSNYIFKDETKITNLRDIDRTIYIDMSNVEETVDDFIMKRIEEINSYNKDCTIASHLSHLRLDLEFDLDKLILLEFSDIINLKYGVFQSYIDSCSDKSIVKYINKMKYNLREPDFRNKQIKEYKKSVFIHEANHIQFPYAYIEDGIIKTPISLKDFASNYSYIFEVTPEFNEFISLLSEIKEAPSYGTLNNFANIILNPQLGNTSEIEATKVLAKLYTKKVNTRWFRLVFNHILMYHDSNEIKRLSKEIYNDVFFSCPMPEEVSELLEKK